MWNAECGTRLRRGYGVAGGGRERAQRSVLFEQQNHVAMGVNFIAVAEVSAGPSSLDSGNAQVRGAV